MGHFRWMTAGESHGPRLTAIIEGVPAGLPLLAEQIDFHLARRQKGYGRGGRMKIETDRVVFSGGLRDGKTLGSPIALVVENRDHQNWLDRMAAGPLPKVPEAVTRPRPGHADLAGGLKYDTKDLRNILERASARETAARTAVGSVARTLLAEVGVRIFAHVVAIGEVAAEPHDGNWEELEQRSRASDLACGDDAAAEKMRNHIRETAHKGDTLGGIVEAVALGLPPGLGSHVHWDRKLDGRIAQAMMCIHAIKAVEIGDGWAAGRTSGSRVHDPIHYENGQFTRSSNHAGGLEGGITNGQPVVVRAAMKPIATLKKALPSADVNTKEAFDAAFERSDVCAVPAASVVAEAMLAIVLADALLEKFGGDSVGELKRNVEGFRAQVEAY